MTRVPEPLIRRLSPMLEPDADTRRRLEEIQGRPESVPAGIEMARSGARAGAALVIQSGWAAVHKLLRDGRQQILSFALPGDVLGMHGALFGNSEPALRSLTEVVVRRIEADAMIGLLQSAPRLAFAVFALAARDRALLAEQVVRVGRRTAYERTAHLIMELLRRLETAGLVQANSFELAPTQEMLADSLGLTPVHVNRTLRRLRDEGLIRLARRRLTVLQRGALRRAAGFDPSYLEAGVPPAEIADRVGAR